MTKEMAEKFSKRFAVPGFQHLFNKHFLIESAKHPMGTVDVEELAAKVFKILNINDPTLTDNPKGE